MQLNLKENSPKTKISMDKFDRLYDILIGQS